MGVADLLLATAQSDTDSDADLMRNACTQPKMELIGSNKIRGPPFVSNDIHLFCFELIRK